MKTGLILKYKGKNIKMSFGTTKKKNAIAWIGVRERYEIRLVVYGDGYNYICECSLTRLYMTRSEDDQKMIIFAHNVEFDILENGMLKILIIADPVTCKKIKTYHSIYSLAWLEKCLSTIDINNFNLNIKYKRK